MFNSFKALIDQIRKRRLRWGWWGGVLKVLLAAQFLLVSALKMLSAANVLWHLKNDYGYDH